MYARSSEDVAIPVAVDAAVDWPKVVEATYSLHQRYRYDYPAPIADLHHRLMVVPRPNHGDQRRIASRLDVAPRVDSNDSVDAYGNPVTTVFARRIERSIEFAHWSVVARTSGVDHLLDRDALSHPMLHTPTELTAADADLRAIAKTLRLRYDDETTLADAGNAYVRDQMAYVSGSTCVETTAPVAFAGRKGVCQDFAHVMIAIARRAGLAARYVSGHLVGEGGTHAWVEILVAHGAHTRVLAYDPTHGCRVDMRYLVVSVGRDYSDVAPTSGVFTAPHPGEMSATKRVGTTHVRYAA